MCTSVCLCAVVLVAFTLPKIYETYKDHIDEGLETAKVHTQKFYNTSTTEVNKFVDKSPMLQNMRAKVYKKTE